MERAVLIQGRLNINRALNDDTVAVELLPEDQWCRPTNVIIDQEKQEEENKGIKKCISSEFLLVKQRSRGYLLIFSLPPTLWAVRNIR